METALHVSNAIGRDACCQRAMERWIGSPNEYEQMIGHLRRKLSRHHYLLSNRYLSLSKRILHRHFTQAHHRLHPSQRWPALLYVPRSSAPAPPASLSSSNCSTPSPDLKSHPDSKWWSTKAEARLAEFGALLFHPRQRHSNNVLVQGAQGRT